MKVFQWMVALLLLASTTVGATTAEQVIDDDLIVQGNQCVGTDCALGTDFSAGVLKMMENNLRVRFMDNTAQDSGTYSWTLVSNDAASGGAEYLRLDWLSNQRQPVLSDGTAPDYDCTVWPPAVIGTIPAGEPIETEYCQPVTAYDSNPVVTVGAGGGITLGRDSAAAGAELSLGREGLERHLRHLAEALADTDVLVKHQLDGYDPLASRREALAALSLRVDELETGINQLKAALAPPDTDGDRDSDNDWLGAFGGLWLLVPGLLLLARRR